MPVGMFPRRTSRRNPSGPSGFEAAAVQRRTLGDAPDMDEFVALCTQLSATGAGWLDALIGRLPVAADGRIEDDCALVEVVAFPGANAEAGQCRQGQQRARGSAEHVGQPVAGVASAATGSHGLHGLVEHAEGRRARRTARSNSVTVCARGRDTRSAEAASHPPTA